MASPTNKLPARREFIKTSTAAALGGTLASYHPSSLAAEPSMTGGGSPAANKAVEIFYNSLSKAQKMELCFDWDYRVNIKYEDFRATVYDRPPPPKPDPDGILLRTHVSNAWKITRYSLNSSFYTDKQRELILDILKAILKPGWTEKLQQQALDDTGDPWGANQSLAIFGTPGTERYQCVITGFHLTIRAGSDPEMQAAFGGPISHGHQPSGFYEKQGHPDNIFWHQAQAANKVYQILDSNQQAKALFTGPVPYFVPPGAPDRPLSKVSKMKSIERGLIRDGTPRDDTREAEIRFRDQGDIPGLPLTDVSSDQKQAVHKVLQILVAPYCQEYQEQVMDCLKKQGGLDACRLTFYQQKDLGDDGEWDCWRLEGPAFVWFFRGTPHVHVYIHVANDPKAPVSAFFG